MYAEVRIPDHTTRARSLPVVPETALVWRGSLPGVFVVTNGRLSLRLLRLGVPTGTGVVSVLAGLRGGEQIVLKPPPGLASGIKKAK